MSAARDPLPDAALRSAVREFWDAAPCGTEGTSQPRYSRAYFDEIEARRYALEPEIFSFAQFTRHHGRSVLEVGIGAATDFTQWVRAGARAWGVDLTPEAVRHAEEQLAVYGLGAEEIRVADCEALPYPDDSFDLVYSWGVIHHTPNTAGALAEIIRVTRPGGRCKVMIYNRHSQFAFLQWMRRGLLAGRPWLSFAAAIYDLESPGTKAFTRAEVRAMLSALPVEAARIRTVETYSDRLGASGPVARACAAVLSRLLGDRFGWFLLIDLEKVQL